MNVETDCIVVDSWSDMKQFGINALTGEGCAFYMRLTCDVNQAGLDLLADYLGLSTLEPAPAWNSQVGDEPTVGSLMLSSSELSTLATFALFRQGALAVVTLGTSIRGIFSDELLGRYRKHQVGNIRQNPVARFNAPRVGTRNVHMASGRA